jgi:mannose-6-phosphate isomerase-like protein (cupin superfamily)
MIQVEELIPDALASLDPEALNNVLLSRQETFGKLSLALNRRRQAGRLYVPAAEAAIRQAGPQQRMIVGPELGFEIYNFHLFTSGRAAGSDRYHTHGDAVKYYISGHGFEVIGDQRFEVSAGDFMHVPANVWHGTENPSDEPLVFLAAQQFPGTFRQVPAPFVHQVAPHAAPAADDLTESGLAGLEPWPLYLLYLQQQMELGKVLLEIQRRRQQRRLYVPAADAPLLDWGPGRHLIIAPELGFDIYTFSVFLQHVPGGTLPAELETVGETVKYYLSGRGIEQIGGQRFEVAAGDVLYIPANTPYHTANPGPEPLRFLCWQQLPGTFSQIPSPFLAPSQGSGA